MKPREAAAGPPRFARAIEFGGKTVTHDAPCRRLSSTIHRSYISKMQTLVTPRVDAFHVPSTDRIIPNATTAVGITENKLITLGITKTHRNYKIGT